MDYFLQHHLRAADCIEQGRRYFIVLNVESSNRSGDKNYWHKKELEKCGEGRREMEKRAQYQCEGRGNDYWGDRNQEMYEGIITGNVASIQMSAIDDVGGEYSFAANCLSMAANSRDGLLAFPLSFEQLLTHRSTCFVNVEGFGDIDGIVKSFFRKKVENISYLEAAKFFEMSRGADWSGSQPGQTPSLLSIIKRAFPGKTMNKNPRIPVEIG